MKLTGAAESVTRTSATQASEGDHIELIVKRSPFYAEAGGQVGDAGVILGTGFAVAIEDTQKPTGDTHLHRGRVTSGTVNVGDNARLEVDHGRRSAIRRNHSATHLLHWALHEVLGPHAQQKGSLVGAELLRFDFAHHQAMTAIELRHVEDLVNAKVLGAAAVQTAVLPIAAARELGAMAIFEEKYGDVVRVLTMTADSVELCGGTHCTSLGEIGMFKIVSEAGTAAGVRRILAVTGENALAPRRGRAAAGSLGGEGNGRCGPRGANRQNGFARASARKTSQRTREATP